MWKKQTELSPEVALKVETLYDILTNCQGEHNAICSAKLADEVGIKVSSGSPRIRGLILTAITKYRIPIGSNSNGYFLIVKRAELDTYIKSLQKRQKGIQNRIDLITTNFKKFWGHMKV